MKKFECCPLISCYREELRKFASSCPRQRLCFVRTSVSVSGSNRCGSSNRGNIHGIPSFNSSPVKRHTTGSVSNSGRRLAGWLKDATTSASVPDGDNFCASSWTGQPLRHASKNHSTLSTCYTKLTCGIGIVIDGSSMLP